MTIADLSDDNALSAECLALVGTSLPAGETVSCTGCHESRGTAVVTGPTLASTRPLSQIEPARASTRRSTCSTRPDLVVLNKFERRGAEDALRDVRKQVKRNRELWHTEDEALPVFGTIASQFDDHGVNGLYVHLLEVAARKGGAGFTHDIPSSRCGRVTKFQHMFPPERVGHLREIAETCRGYRAEVEEQARAAGHAHALEHFTLDGKEFLVIWAHARTMTWGIHAARVSSAGAVLDPAGLVVSASDDYSVAHEAS